MRPPPSEGARLPLHSRALDRPDRGALERDRALLRRWRDGDVAAGETLLAHYHAMFLGLCARHRLPRADVADVWSELVLHVLERLPRLADEIRSSFAGFLSWQVRHLLQRRRRQQLPSPPADALPAHDDGPLPPLLAWDAIQHCSQSLSAREAQVFDQRFIQGSSLRDIATTLDSNDNAIAQCLFRLTRKLRHCLQRNGFDLGAGS